MDRKLPFRIYEGDSLFHVPEEASDPLIQDILYKHDFVMLIAEDKMGKTILSMQMAASLSSGTPFLGIFDVPKPVSVWYFAHEGKDDSLVDRVMRINSGVKVNPDNFKMFCGSKFRWNEKESDETVNWLLAKYHETLPKAIFVDPLYAASVGDLNSNASMKEFIHALRCMAEACGAAIFLIHHMKKNQRDDKGNYYGRSDSDAYGSATIKWAVDHVFWLDRFKGEEGDKLARKDKWLRCDTQRGGNIASGVRLRLGEPDPLGFYVVEKHLEGQHKVLSLLKSKPDGLDVNQIMKLSNIKRASLYTILSELLNNSLIYKIEGRPVLYKIREHYEEEREVPNKMF